MYFQSQDETVGCYLLAVSRLQLGDLAQAFAEHIQTIHERSFRADAKSDWQTVARGGFYDGPVFRSRLDMYDEGSKYRVLSLVVASENDAIRVTVHNYRCEDYAANKNAYSHVEKSIRQIAPGT